MPQFVIDIAHASDIGLKRELNEDSCFGEVDTQTERSGILGVLVVADGVGGQDAGDVASKIACDVLQHLFARSGYLDFARECGIAEDDHPSLLSESLRYIHQKITERALVFHGDRTMGCTCVAGLLVSDGKTGAQSLVLSWAGDSRCYVARGNEILLATEDDSYVWDLYRQGKISYPEMRLHPKRNVVTQALGMNTAIHPRSNVVPLKPNDTILLCTDGLHSGLPDQDIKKILETSGDAAQACRALVDAANKVGGKDNISVVVARCPDLSHKAMQAAPRKTPIVSRAAVAGVLLTALAAISYVYVAPTSTTTQVPSTPASLAIEPISDSYAVGQPVSIRFAVEPHDGMTRARERYMVVADIDSRPADTMLLPGIEDTKRHEFSIPVRFSSASLHQVRISVFGELTHGRVCSDAAIVTVREPLPHRIPEQRTRTATVPIRERAVPLFTCMKGVDGKILLKANKEVDIEQSIDVDIASRGHEDVVTLSRINKNVPKETALDYRAGDVVVTRIIGSRKTFSQRLQ